MFDSLKKKLKEAVEKVSKTIKEEPKQSKEQKMEEDKILLENIEKEAMIVEGEKILEEKEKIKIEEKQPSKAETYITEEAVLTEEKKKPGLFARVFEKEITEQDVQLVMKELQLALLENDVALEVAEKISDDIKKELTGKYARRGKIEELIENALKNAMLDVMKQEKINLEELINEKDGPFTIVFLGFNGTGKTTTIAKFAHKFKKYNPIIAAADTFRAASIEQLETHSERLGVRLVKHKYGADPAAVIFDAKKAALASNSKLVLADTAGRSHSNVNLMDELKKIVRVNNPDLKILVLDSITGNDIFEQSRLFNEAVGVDAVVLTKADVYDKGGAALSAAHTIKRPILYMGTGQEYSDLKEFNPEEIVGNLMK